MKMKSLNQKKKKPQSKYKESGEIEKESSQDEKQTISKKKLIKPTRGEIEEDEVAEYIKDKKDKKKNT